MKDFKRTYKSSKTLNPKAISISKSKINAEPITQIIEDDEHLTHSPPNKRKIANLIQKVVFEDLLEVSINNLLNFFSMSELSKLSTINNLSVNRYYCKKLQKFTFKPISDRNNRISNIVHLAKIDKLYVAISSEDTSTQRKSREYSVKVYDISTGNFVRKLEGHNSWVQCVHFLEQFDGQSLASGSDDANIKIWNLLSGTCTRTLAGHTSYVLCLNQLNSYSSDELISGSADKSVKIWTLISGQCLKTLKGHEDFVNTIIELPFRKEYKLYSFATSGNDGQIRIWDYDSANCLSILQESHKSCVNSIIYMSNDSGITTLNVILSGEKDGVIRVWDYDTGKIIDLLRGHSKAVTCLALNKATLDENTFFSGSEDKTVRLWDFNNRVCYETIDVGSSVSSICNLRYLHPSMIAIGSVSTISILKYSSKPQKTLKSSGSGSNIKARVNLDGSSSPKRSAYGKQNTISDFTSKQHQSSKALGMKFNLKR